MHDARLVLIIDPMDPDLSALRNRGGKLIHHHGWADNTQLVASHLTNGVVDRTRPLCSYPDVARYTGTGSIDDANNFMCTPAIDIELLPTVLDLRSGGGWAAVSVTVGGGF